MKLSATVARALREGALWFLGALALMLILALLSYHKDDASFWNTGDGGSVHNWIGPVGAWLAGFFFSLFGRPAYLFPVMLAYAGWLVHKEQALPDARSRINTILRAAGFGVTLLTSCGLASLHWDGAALPSSAGGVVGEFVGGHCEVALRFLGATLLLLALWFSGVALFLGVSWFDVMDKLGAWVLEGINWAQTKIEQRRELASGQQRKQARQGVVREEQKKVASRPPPRIEPVAPIPEKSERIERERQVPLFDAPKSSELPALSLLDEPGPREQSYSDEALEAMSRLVEIKLRDFGVEAEVVAVQPGPVITRFELRPAPGVKVSQISGLAKDLARALSAISVRVVEIIPGKSVIGLEIPNEKREIVTLGEIIKSKPYDEVSSPLALALGKDIGGVPVVADLARMPHLLIAGTTGSGKSVGINAMVLSLVYKASPEHVRMIMIDPKMLELSVYEGIPHLLSPVVTDMKQAANALKWAVDEMERRYQLFANAGTKNITTFNGWVEKVRRGELPAPKVEQVTAIDASGETVTVPTSKDAGDGVLLPDLLPYIVIVVDEFADLMMQQGKEVEVSVARLAQKARAAGMHVVLATQRPSVDVITGMIKANFPSRIGFRVAQKVDSRTILDEQGAELLLGRGDMLVKMNGANDTQRVQCPFVSEEEVSLLTDHLRAQGSPEYNEAILLCPDEEGTDEEADEVIDPRFDEAVRIVAETQRCSTSWLQRKMTVGYNRAAKIVEMMEKRGMVGPPNGAKDREILVHAH